MNESNFEARHQAALETESARVAEEKLERIMGDEYVDFIVRMVNKLEYADILRTGEMWGSFAYFPSDTARVMEKTLLSFREYLADCVKRGWANVAVEQTSWVGSVRSMNMYEKLMGFLKQAKNDVMTQAGVTVGYREKIHAQLRESILADMKKRPSFYYEAIDKATRLPELDHTIETNLQNLRDTLQNEEAVQQVIQLIDDAMSTFGFRHSYIPKPKSIDGIIASVCGETEEKESALSSVNAIMKNKGILCRFGRDNLITLKCWLDDPESIDLHKFMNALSYSQRFDLQGEPDADVFEQYHIALVVDHSFAEGGKIKMDAPTNRALLAVIDMMPDRELLADILSQARHAGTLSHPVFDHRGKIRFPTDEKK